MSNEVIKWRLELRISTGFGCLGFVRGRLAGFQRTGYTGVEQGSGEASRGNSVEGKSKRSEFELDEVQGFERFGWIPTMESWCFSCCMYKYAKSSSRSFGIVILGQR